ncbi:SDR family NAD(P)-dependent oxidoreductase [Actinomadura sp. KC345]|uniref:NAD(P)H-binding protein n=1 Tax=Actinomadura sp. KC345 TaxID=2530371 RepID=UPI00104E89C0|nr:NAD(P)H-binding protein [Actinomadura sp. KC345]TDC44732.1 SDR family NAD(P)-dependent oxidoreductase [Actinomadura sp. KC345]
MDEILVMAATGKTGRRVASRLGAQGRRVRRASRSAEVRFDWTDPGTWEKTLEGARAVYLVAPDDPGPVGAFVEQAVGSGVRRLVLLSGRGIEHVGPDFAQGMAEAERAVRGSGAEWTILRPNQFDQNFDEDVWLAPLRAGRLALPIGATPEPFIDVEDVAAAAVAALTRDGHAGRVYGLTGPRALTFGEAVATMAGAAGRSIEFAELTPEAYRAELLAEGWPEEAANAMNGMFALHRAGHLAEATDDVHQMLGRPPAPFEDYAVRTAASGAWSL